MPNDSTLKDGGKFGPSPEKTIVTASLTPASPPMSRITQIDLRAGEHWERLPRRETISSAPPCFQEWRILRQFPSTGGEADIFLIEKDQTRRILKLFRFGLQPKSEVIDRLKSLSEKFSDFFVRIFERDFDPSYGRFFEVEEFVRGGTLDELMRKKTDRAANSICFENLDESSSNSSRERCFTP